MQPGAGTRRDGSSGGSRQRGLGLLLAALAIAGCRTDSSHLLIPDHDAAPGADGGESDMGARPPRPGERADGATGGGQDAAIAVDARAPVDLRPADAGGAGSPDAATPAVDASPRDVGRDSGAMPPPPRFSPAQLEGLVLWLDANESATARTIEGDKLSSWNDRSPHKNDAVPTLPMNRPTYVAPGKDGPGEIVFGAETPLSVRDAPMLRWKGDFAVFVVARHRSTPGRQAVLLYKQEDRAPWTGLVLYANAPDANAGRPWPGTPRLSLGPAQQILADAGGTDDGRRHVVGARRRGATVELRVDGKISTATFAPTLDLSAPGRDLVIGAWPPLEGAVSEVIAVEGTLSDEAVAELERYLRGRYGI
jgi:hypothetical protein